MAATTSTQVTNLTGGNLTLPPRYGSGVVASSASVTIADRSANVYLFLGGSATVLGNWRLTEVTASGGDIIPTPNASGGATGPAMPAYDSNFIHWWDCTTQTLGASAIADLATPASNLTANGSRTYPLGFMTGQPSTVKPWNCLWTNQNNSSRQMVASSRTQDVPQPGPWTMAAVVKFAPVGTGDKYLFFWGTGGGPARLYWTDPTTVNATTHAYVGNNNGAGPGPIAATTANLQSATSTSSLLIVAVSYDDAAAGGTVTYSVNGAAQDVLTGVGALNWGLNDSRAYCLLDPGSGFTSFAGETHLVAVAAQAIPLATFEAWNASINP